MQSTTRHWVNQPVWGILYGLAVLSLLGLALLGQTPGEVAGWWVTAVAESAGPVRCVPLGVRWRYRRACRLWDASLMVAGRYLWASWPSVLLGSLALWGVWECSGRWGPGWLQLLPWGLWLWQGLGVGWPQWRRRRLWRWGRGALWQAQRLLLLGYGLMGWQRGAGDGPPWALGAGCVACARDEPYGAVARQPDGSYQATLCGHFTLTVAGDHLFRMRLPVLFLGLLDGPGPQRCGRRTRFTLSHSTWCMAYSSTAMRSRRSPNPVGRGV